MDLIWTGEEMQEAEEKYFGEWSYDNSQNIKVKE